MSPNVILDPRLTDLVEPDAKPQQIAGGFVFTEGPIWRARDQSLIFSDVQGDTIYRWTNAGGSEVFRAPSASANGNTFDGVGNLLTCEHQNRRVSRTLPDGSIEDLVTNYQGKRLNSPNDIICAENGDILFTDPPYGLRQPDGTFLPGELPFAGVFRLSAEDGSLTLLADDFAKPNGLVIRDGDQQVLINDTDNHVVRVFDFSTDSGLSNGRVFADVSYQDTIGRPDGMKLDSNGNLYVAANTAEGIWVFSPDAVLLGFIGLPEPPANLAWGEEDWRTLFITARTSVYRLPMKIPGQPLASDS